MINKIKKIIGNNKEFFIEYKYTLFLLLVNTIIMVIDFENNDLTELLTTLLLSNILFFMVDTFAKKDKLKIPLMLVSILISYGINTVLYNTENTPRIPFLAIGFYLSIFIITIYKISKKEDNFPSYLLKVFNNNIILAISSIILQLGLLFIGVVTEELLFKNEYLELIARLEIIFMGLYVVPGELLCLTKTNSENLKISKFLICYLLLPIVLLTELIIYIYFFKILFTWTMPVNILFTFITLLIILSFPTIILLNNYKDDSKFIKFIDNYIIYSFIPIIILQLVSMLMRISGNGITLSRYFAIMVVIFEIILFILIIKKEHLHKLFIAATILVLITFDAPFINCLDISRMSQINIITSIYKKDTVYANLAPEDKDKVYSSYLYLDYELNATDYLPDYIDANKIKDYYKDYRYSDEESIYYNNSDKEMNIEGYKKLKELNIREYTRSNPKSVSDLLLDDLDITDDNTIIIAKCKEYLADIIDRGEVTNNIINLSDNYDYYITNLDIYYSKTTNKINSLNIDGYLLTK